MKIFQEWESRNLIDGIKIHPSQCKVAEVWNAGEGKQTAEVINIVSSGGQLQPLKSRK